MFRRKKCKCEQSCLLQKEGKVDKSSRIFIPKEVKEVTGIVAGCPVEIKCYKDKMIITKAE